MASNRTTKAELDELEAKVKRAVARKENALARKAELEVAALKRDQDDADASDSANRTYQFYAEVDDDTVGECLDAVNIWFRQDPKAPITIILNSPGGYTVDGFALYDRLRQIVEAGTPVITIGTGHVASMGGVLHQAGSKRILTKNAYLLIHEAASMAFGKGSSVKDKAKHLEDIFARITRIFAERSGGKMTAAQIKNRANRKDYIVWAEEAIRLGFCDEVS